MPVAIKNARVVTLHNVSRNNSNCKDKFQEKLPSVIQPSGFKVVLRIGIRVDGFTSFVSITPFLTKSLSLKRTLEMLVLILFEATNETAKGFSEALSQDSVCEDQVHFIKKHYNVLSLAQMRNGQTNI